MRALKYGILICVAALVWLTGYLFLRFSGGYASAFHH